MAGAERGGGRPPTEARQAPLIRNATLADAGEIARVHVDSWRDAYRDHMPADLLASLSVERREAVWKDAIADPQISPLVAERDGEIVGFVSVGPSRSETGNGELYAIYAAPAHIGTGVGRRLMEAALERLRTLGYREAMLWVLNGNERAERFYAIGGWRREDAYQTEEIGSTPVREVRYRIAL